VECLSQTSIAKEQERRERKKGGQNPEAEEYKEGNFKTGRENRGKRV